MVACLRYSTWPLQNMEKEDSFRRRLDLHLVAADDPVILESLHVHVRNGIHGAVFMSCCRTVSPTSSLSAMREELGCPFQYPLSYIMKLMMTEKGYMNASNCWVFVVLC